MTRFKSVVEHVRNARSLEDACQRARCRAKRFQRALQFGLGLLIVALGAALLPAADETKGAAKASDDRQVVADFQAECHQPAKPGGKYVMTDFSSLLAGGESGDKATVLFSPDSNLLAVSVEQLGIAGDVQVWDAATYELQVSPECYR